MTATHDSELKRKTAKGLLWGGIGSGTMQLLNLLFGIFLARLLSPADYGTIGALTIFSATAGIFTESGFILAIVNKKEVDRNDYNAVFWFSVTAAVILYGILYAAAPLIARFYHTPEITPLARFLFIAFVIGGISTAPVAYLFRNLQVKQRSVAMIVATVASGVVGITCACMGFGAWGIATQTVVYALCSAAIHWHYCPWRPSFSFKPKVLKELLPFSVKQLITTLFTYVNNNLFAVLLGRFYNLTITGFYTQGNKWTTMGYSTINYMINSVGQPVLRQTVEDTTRLHTVFGKLLRFTAFVSFPAMFGLAIIAPELITVAITDKWLDSVPVIQILCIGSAFLPLNLLFSNLFNSLGKPGVYMWNTIALGSAQIVGIIISYRFGLNTMLAVYSALNIVWFFVWQHFAARHAAISLKSVLKDIAPYALIAVASLAITVAVVSQLHIAPWLSLLAKIALAAALYCLTLWRLNSVIFKECIAFLTRRKPQ